MTSRVAIPLDGTTRLFNVPFPFLDRSHVGVLVNRVSQFTPLDYEWVSDTSIQFTKAPSGVLELFRQTPANKALVEFHNGSSLTEDELNLAVKQALFLCEETRDYYDSLISGRLDDLVSGIAPGTTPQGVLDAVVQEILRSEELANLQARIKDIDLNATSVGDQQVRLDTLQHAVDALANVDGTSITTFLLDEQQARIDGDTALNDTIHLMGAKSADSTAFVFDLDRVKVSPTESLGMRFSGLKAATDANTAAITSEKAARTDADSALSSRIDTLSASVGNNLAAIQTEQKARADGDSANATSIATLQTKVNGNTASIQTLQTVSDGLKAQYMVKTDVNGYVAGFGLYNSGNASRFIILADQFAVVKPGYAQQVPFIVGNIGGSTGVGINGNMIVNGTIYASALNVDRLSAVSADMGTVTAGKIMLSGGGRSLILQGSATYPIWFGTSTVADEANALFYCRDNGDLFFKGKVRGSTLDMRSTVIDTGGGRTAPFVIFDTANAGSSTGGTTLIGEMALCVSPDYGGGYYGTRFAHRKLDVFFFANASGNGSGNTTIFLEVQYDGGAWQTFATNVFSCVNNASESLACRYTTAEWGWSTVKFRCRSGGLTHALSVNMQVFNFSPSIFDAGSCSNVDSGASSGGSGGGSGTGGTWCVTAASFLSATQRALAAAIGDVHRTYLPTTGIEPHAIEAVGAPVWERCVRLTTACGAELECSYSTPFNLRSARSDLEDGAWKLAPAMHGEEVLVEDASGKTSWQRVTRVKDIGMQLVVPISFGGRSFAAGVRRDRRIYSHNMAKPYLPP